MQRCLPGRECVFTKPSLNRIRRRMRWAKTAFPVTEAAMAPQSPTHNQTKSTHRRSQSAGSPQAAKPVDTPAKVRKRLTPMHQQRKIAREAKSLASQGNWKLALQKLQQGLQQWPGNGHLALQAASLHAKHNDAVAARQHYALAVAAKLRGTIAIQAWAGFEVKQKQYGKAHELFQQALAQEQSAERQASLLKASGDALILQGRAVEAGSAYGQALVLLPESLETTVAYARLKQKIGQLQDARELYETAIKLDPQHVLAYQGLGHLESCQGNYHLAQRVFQEGRQNCPPYPPLLNTWASMEANRFNISKARSLYEAALETNPNHLQTLLALGSLEGRAGNVERGMGHLQKGLNVQPGNKYFQHAVAQLKRHHGSKEEAKEQLQQVLVDNPSSGHAWYTLGEMAEETGDRSEAARCYEQGIKALGMFLPSHRCQLGAFPMPGFAEFGEDQKVWEDNKLLELGIKASDILLPHISGLLSMSGFAMFE